MSRNTSQLVTHLFGFLGLGAGRGLGAGAGSKSRTEKPQLPLPRPRAAQAEGTVSGRGVQAPHMYLRGVKDPGGEVLNALSPVNWEEMRAAVGERVQTGTRIDLQPSVNETRVTTWVPGTPGKALVLPCRAIWNLVLPSAQSHSL